MKDNLTLWQGVHWQINVNTRFGIPGYCFVNSLGAQSQSFCDLSEDALVELGPTIGRASRAVEQVLDPIHVFVGKFGMVPGFAIHFHIVPVAEWMLDAFARDERFEVLADLTPPDYPANPVAAQLLMHFWREYCHGKKGIPEAERQATYRALAEALN